MKRLSILLLLILAFSLLLTSCNDTKNPAESTESQATEENIQTVTIEISKYTLIVAESANSALRTSCAGLYREVKAKTNSDFVDYKEDWLNPTTNEQPVQYEILVGNTNRPETQQVLDKLEELTYTVEMVNDKIVIVGKSDQLTINAIDYFINNILAASAGNDKLELRLSDGVAYLSEKMPMANITLDGVAQYVVMFSDDIDNTYSSNTEDNDNSDSEALWSRTIRERIASVSGIADVQIKTDWVARGSEPDSQAYEILVGDTNRAETAEVKNSLKYNQYAVKCVGNKIVIVGWNLTTTYQAVQHFTNLVQASSVTVEGQETKNISIPGDYEFIGSYDKWLVDIPEYENGTVGGTYDCNNSTLQIYITDTTETAYKAYCDKVAAAGFDLYQTNQIGNNLFATYTKGTDLLHTYFFGNSKEVRIITSLDAYLPDNEKNAQYTKIVDSTVSQLTLDYASGNFGMSYVIQLEDSSFVVYDGGGSSGGIDHIRLYNLMKQLNKSADDKIHIAAWIITHDHWDHTSVFDQYTAAYAGTSELEMVIANVPQSFTSYNSGNPGNYANSSLVTAAARLGGKVVKCHTGMKFTIRNITVSFLYTHEDLYPTRLYIFNNSTTVTRIDMKENSFVFLGDIQTAGSKQILLNFTTADLDCDVVQTAHHGYDGASQKLYIALKPEYLLWPTDSTSFKNQTDGTSTALYRTVDYYIATKMNVQKIYVAGDGTVTISLPFAP